MTATNSTAAENTLIATIENARTLLETLDAGNGTEAQVEGWNDTHEVERIATEELNDLRWNEVFENNTGVIVISH